MNLEILSRGTEVNAPLKKYVERKVVRLEKLFDDIQSVRIVFSKERFSFRCEVNVVDRHGTTKGKETTDEDFRAAFDLVLDKLEARGRKSKAIIKEEKRRPKPGRGRRQLEWQVNVIDRMSLAEDETPRVVKKTRLPIHPMTIEDAAVNLERSRNEFIVFRDAASDRVSVLYRRRDNNFGLIEPEI
jgi:putative sigma-54 modulation protein